MSTHIITLQDQNIRIWNEQGALLNSPGFANIARDKPIFGEDARRLFRLHPRQSFNQFWSQLSLDKLVNTNAHFRHQADLAYAHLNSLAESCGLDSEVIFAIPSNYSRNQLAILLGLSRQCSFTATGLVDLSVAAVAGLASAPQALYVDMQLHQSVLVRLHNQDGHLERETVQQIPGAGLMALHDAWSSMITEAFIKQSRFNPLHNAETEQYIYNRLEEWINAARDDNEVLLEINHKGTVHQAKVNQGYFEQKARNIFGRIRQEIDTLGFAGGEIFMPAETAVLPGVQVYLPALQVVDTEHLARYCLAASEHITGDPESLGFVTRLPAANQAVTSGRAVNPALPSHILVNHRAYRLPDQMLYIGSRPDRLPSGKGISFIEVDDPSLSGPITLSRTSEGFRLEPNSNDSIRINGESPETVNALSLGDRINLVNSGINIQLIQVE